MATTTPNFGWPVPTSTDLVKDGATAMEALGDAIDTSMVDLKGGTTGQVLSKASSADMDFVWVTDAAGDITGVTASSPLTGGGTSGTVTVGIQDATTSQKGAVQLTDSTSSTSTTTAATPNSVKSAYDPAFTNNYYAGKNKALNSDYSIWQRGTSISLPNSFGYNYTADRWVAFSDTGANAVVSRQTFTPGTAPVAGYEGQYFLRYYTANTSVGHILGQRIENVQTFAGQTVTVSFWAKATSALNFSGYCALVQDFGSGGSGIVSTSYTPSPASITTSWQRFSATVTVPSIAGKTIGTGSFLNFQIGAAGNNSLDIWGAQIEAGSTATPFQTATGTIQGELAACQRYYYQWTAANAFSPFATGFTSTLSTANLFKPMPVTMRITPTITTTGTASNYGIQNGTNGRVACSAVPSINQGNPDGLNVDFTTAAVLTAGGGITGNANNTTSAYLGFSAEL